LPVLGKFSIYLTIPSFDDIEKTMEQNVPGKFVFSNISVNYDFTDAFSELELEPKFPIKLKMGAHYFINKHVSDSSFLEVKVKHIF
jgi:hypothetical protein